MRELPILMNDLGVRLLHLRWKTQTRRPIKGLHGAIILHDEKPWQWNRKKERWQPGPYGEPGDRLYVREAWRHWGYTISQGRSLEDLEPWERRLGSWFYRWFRATNSAEPVQLPVEMCVELSEKYAQPVEDRRWRPSIHLPYVLSRFRLDVESIWTERVQRISVEDCRAEGVRMEHLGDRLNNRGTGAIERDVYAEWWDEVYQGSEFAWDNDPKVWVVQFKVVEGPRWDRG